MSSTSSANANGSAKPVKPKSKKGRKLLITTQRKLAFQLSELTSDADGLVFVAKQPKSIDGLVTFLASSDAETVGFALNALMALASEPIIAASLCEHPTLITSLLTCQEHDDPAMATLASTTLEQLNHVINHQPPSSVSSKTTRKSIKEVPLKNFLVSCLGIKDCHNTRVALERAIVSLAGVLSVTLVKEEEIAIVYGRDEAALLERISTAMTTVYTSIAAEKNITQIQPVLPRYFVPPPAKMFQPTEFSKMARFNMGFPQTVNERHAQEKKQAEAAATRASTMNWIGRGVFGLGKALSARGW